MRIWHSVSTRSRVCARSLRKPSQSRLAKENYTILDLQQMVPEACSVCESQSNGKAGIAVQKLEDLARTYKSALETNVQMRIESTSPVMNWRVELAASVYNRHLCNADRQTLLEAIHGQRWRGRAVEFGEKVFYFVPKRPRAKLNLPRRVGTNLGICSIRK